jgi:chemotaxis signal transduction protein
VGSEVVEAGGVAPIPRTPPWLLGVMNLRGRPVPVFDLRVALGLADQEGSRRRLVLVLDKGERAVGIDIDEFPAPLRGLQRANAVPTLPARLAAFVAAAWVGQRTLWLDFEHRGFFDSLAGESGT